MGWEERGGGSMRWKERKESKEGREGGGWGSRWNSRPGGRREGRVLPSVAGIDVAPSWKSWTRDTVSRVRS